MLAVLDILFIDFIKLGCVVRLSRLNTEYYATVSELIRFFCKQHDIVCNFSRIGNFLKLCRQDRCKECGAKTDIILTQNFTLLCDHCSTDSGGYFELIDHINAQRYLGSKRLLPNSFDIFPITITRVKYKNKILYWKSEIRSLSSVVSR